MKSLWPAHRASKMCKSTGWSREEYAFIEIKMCTFRVPTYPVNMKFQREFQFESSYQHSGRKFSILLVT